MTRVAKKIIPDCDLMKYPHSGLYHYCLNFGNSINSYLRNKDEQTISFYVPPAEKTVLNGGTVLLIKRKWHHKFFKPFLWKCKIWHAPFQSGRIVSEKSDLSSKTA